MPSKTQKPIVAGNWKMYKTLPEAISFVEKLSQLTDENKATILLAVPFTMIRGVSEKVEGTPVVIGAQNMNDASQGAFTGEISAKMLKEAGAKFVLLGHSERRQYFHETDEFINKKVKRALEEQLMVILCVGETFEQHESGQIEAALETELLGSLQDLKEEDFQNILIAYEPIWAVGSGKPASPKDVSQENEAIRAIITKKWGKNVGDSLKILYGGSVNPQNAKDFLNEPQLNGVLIGTASLNVDDFAKIISQT